MPNACNIMSRYSVRVAVHLQRGIQRHQCTSASHSSAFDLQDGNLEANTYSQQRQKREDDPPRLQGFWTVRGVTGSNDLHAPCSVV